MTDNEKADSAKLPTFEGRVRGRQSVFRCPKCGKMNIHSAGDGHMANHGACWPNGYYLTTAAEARRVGEGAR